MLAEGMESVSSLRLRQNVRDPKLGRYLSRKRRIYASLKMTRGVLPLSSRRRLLAHIATEIKMDSYQKLRRVQGIAACPDCQSDVEIVSYFMLRDLTLEGHIACHACNAQVGTIAHGKMDFLGYPRFGNWDDGLVKYNGQLKLRRLSMGDEAILDNGWSVAGNGDLFSETVGASCTFRSEAVSVIISLLRHPWSGVAEIRLNGKLLGNVDLFEPNGSMVCRVPVFLGISGATSIIEIRVKDDKHPDSKGWQIHVKGLDYLVQHDGPEIFDLPAVNRGNQYPSRFEPLLNSMPMDAVVLDCGSGDRAYSDPRVVNFEYSSFSAPDVYGDGHKLPFRTQSFDLVLSQAVIENMQDPFAAGREISRVMKSGAILYCESAFMQPLHAVPFHFFNTTVWGIKRVFDALECVDLRSEGNLHDTLSWIYKLTSLHANGYGKKVDELLDIVKELDRHITHEELRMFSSYVVLEAHKPVNETNLLVAL